MIYHEQYFSKYFGIKTFVNYPSQFFQRRSVSVFRKTAFILENRFKYLKIIPVPQKYFIFMGIYFKYLFKF